MENTFTFQQPRSQKRVVLVILAASLFMVGGTFGILAILGTEGAASFAAIMVLVAGVMIAIVRLAKSGMLTFEIAVGQDGFSVKDQASSSIQQYRWSDVTKYRRGNYRYESTEKSYLWIWVKDGKSYFIEDNGAVAERAQRHQEFCELAAHYLAQNDQAKENA